MYARDGTAQGIYPALTREIYRRLGSSVDCRAIPWTRALSEARDATGGIGGLYINQEREAFLDFSEPLYKEDLAVYYREASGFKIRTVGDLRGKTVGVICGWSYGDEFDAASQNAAFIIEVNSSDELNFQKLLAGRIDVVIAVINSGDQFLAREPFAGVITRSEAIFSLDVFIAFHRSLKKKDDLARINAAIAAMKKDGSLERIATQEIARR
jgi:polar amino acid transport system substrate-binding protein